MIKKLMIYLTLCSSAWATTTVSGNIKNLGTGAVSTGSFVRFYLRGCAGNLPRIGGTAIIAPTLGNVYYFDFVPNSSGAISGTLYSTRDATGLLAGDIECGGSNTAVWYGFVPFLNGRAGPETPIHAKNTATIDISNITPITSNPVITAPTGDSTYLRLDAGNSPMTGNLSLGTNSLTAGIVNAVQSCPTTGANFSANLTAGLALIPAAGGYLDCRNLTGTQSMAADVTFTGPVSVLLAGNLVLSGTGRFIQPQAVENVALIGVQGMPSNGPGGGGTIFNYNGSDCGIKVGSAAGTTFGRTVIADLLVNLTGGTGSGICLFRTLETDLHRVVVNGANANPVCVNSDGTGGFSSYTMIYFPIITGCNIGVQFTGPISGNNANQIVGGTVQGPGKANAGSIGVNIVTGDSNAIFDTDIEAADIGLQFGANSIHNRMPVVRMEGSTINTHFKFLSGATFNTVDSIFGVGSSVVVSNAGGVTNFVNLTGGFGQDGSGNNHSYFLNQSDNTMFLKLEAGLTANQQEGLVFLDHTGSGQGTLIQDASNNFVLATNNSNNNRVFAAASGITAIDSVGAQAVQINSGNSTGTIGLQIFNGAASSLQVAAIDGSGRFSEVETTAPSGVASSDLLWADSTAHRWKMNNNNAGADTVVGAATTDTFTNKTVNVPLTSGTGLQIFNTTTTCTTAGSVGATCTTGAISLPVAEADTSYRITCTGKGPTAVPVISSIANSSATQFTITIAALTAVAASYSSYDCIAGHN